MPRTEKTFQAEMKRSFYAQLSPCFYWKIADLGFTNPFDSFLVHNGKAHAFEYKIVKDSKTVNFKNLFKNRLHQIHYLDQVKCSGGFGWVLINMFKAREWNYILLFSIDEVEAFLTLDYRFKIDNDTEGMKINKIKIENHTEKLWNIKKIIDE